ncbi:MAG: hypothetical protein LBU26_03750, partial [Synergistaceae bacterium]|nr:hypothetical protein [Synergistaceae bacterium]
MKRKTKNEEVIAVALEFLSGKFTEAELENAIVALFQEQGYSYVHGDVIHRKFPGVTVLRSPD